MKLKMWIYIYIYISVLKMQPDSIMVIYMICAEKSANREPE